MTRAYHREIGREATARIRSIRHQSIAYHREIGREATAVQGGGQWVQEAYHREIRREATALMAYWPIIMAAYHREIGREATALHAFCRPHLEAYHREIGREATTNALPLRARIREPVAQRTRRPRTGVHPSYAAKTLFKMKNFPDRLLGIFAYDPINLHPRAIQNPRNS